MSGGTNINSIRILDFKFMIYDLDAGSAELTVALFVFLTAATRTRIIRTRFLISDNRSLVHLLTRVATGRLSGA